MCKLGQRIVGMQSMTGGSHLAVRAVGYYQGTPVIPPPFHGGDIGLVLAGAIEHTVADV